MSNSSPSSSQPPQQEQTLKSDAVLKVSPSFNQETLNKPDPPPKSDTETPNPLGHNLDPEYNSPEAEEEGEEIDEAQEQEILAVSSGMPLYIDPPIADPHESVSDITITSPSGDPSVRRGSTKRKKGKAKSHVKKQQAIQEKFRTLMEKLNPIPFIPPRIPNFVSHEKLLKKLGLWDFVNIDFDRIIRTDLIGQLVASYNPKQRASYVNDYRVMVNRADLARAFKLPLKKERGSVGGVEVDCVWEDLSHDSIAFVVDFMSEWLLLHDDIWVMSNEVMDWMMMIKDGHPEKVDWAGLLWLMVEKELKQGVQLKDCYYASHLQHLIKSQHEHLFSAQTIDPQEEEVDGEAKEKEGEEVEQENVKVVGAIGSPRVEGPTLEGPSTKLTLGHDDEEEKGMNDMEMNDAEKFNGSYEEDGGVEQGQWLLNGKNDEGEHFLQPCGVNNAEEFGTFEDKKDEDEEMDGEEEGEEEREEDEEEARNDFHVFPNDDALEEDTFTGNLLQGMGANPSSMDARADFFNNSGKRVIDHDNHISHHSLNDNNKRSRINDTWDNKPVDLETCLNQIQQMTEKARILYAEKQHALMQTNMNQQLLLNEVQKRDAVIEHLHKARMDETQKRDREIYRLERELNLMGDVLDGYRKALKDVQKAFTEYKEKAKLHEEPTYKDAGPGGLMLTGPELERRREEYKMNCMIIEHKVKEVEEDLTQRFNSCIEKISLLDKMLTGLEADAKEVFELYVNRKAREIEENSADENVGEVSGCQPSPKPEEEEAKLPHVGESPVNE